MRLSVGRAHLSGSRGDAARGSRRAACGSACGSIRTSRSASPLFAEGKANGYLLQKPNGDVWQTDQWQAGMGIVDFTNPGGLRLVRGTAARACSTWAWTASRPTSASGSRPMSSTTTAPTREKMHNYYTLPLQQGRVRRADGERAAWARRCCSPDRRRPAASSFRSTGAATATRSFESMAESLRGGLSLCLSRLRLLEPRHRRLRGHAAPPRYTSAGSPSACSRRTAACTAALRTASHGCSTRKRSTCCAIFTKLKCTPDAVSVRAAPQAATQPACR